MKVDIRTDASLQIGMGHVMQCLTLAQEIDYKILTKEKILQLITENNKITRIALASQIGVSENAKNNI